MAEIQHEEVDKLNEDEDIKVSNKDENDESKENDKNLKEEEDIKEDTDQIKENEELKTDEVSIENVQENKIEVEVENEVENENVPENADPQETVEAADTKIEDNENELEPSKDEIPKADNENEVPEQTENQPVEPVEQKADNEEGEQVNAEDVAKDENAVDKETQEEQPTNNEPTKEQTSAEIIDDILEEIIMKVCGVEEVVDKEVVDEDKDQEQAEITDENIHTDRIEEVEEEDDQQTGRVEFDIPESQREDDLLEEGEGAHEFPLETESHYEDEGQEEEEEEMDEEELLRNQEDLIAAIEEAKKEGQNLREKNTSLQHKLGDFLRKKKAAEQQAGVQPITEDKDQTDYDTKYEKQMEQIGNMELDFEEIQGEFQFELEEYKEATATVEEQFKQDNDKVQEYRQRIGEKSVNTRTGKRMNSKDIELLFANEQNKEKVVVSTRLDSIKLQNEVNKIKAIIQSKEELADGLHLIDFEQFKIENQSYNEKLEERNEDIMKLRKKIMNNVHILTHVKEKLEFTKHECTEQERDLGELDTNLNGQRDKLNSLKKIRDNLRIKNEKLKKSCGMLGNTDLLRNYENCVDKRDDKTRQLAQMKNRHTELSLHDHTLKMKIDNSKQLEHL